jgi:hypothetical protein
MASGGSHIIQKQTLALTVNGQVDGLDLQRQADNLVKKDLMPKLEQLMDRYSQNQWVRIDKLAIEIPDLQGDDFAGSFSDRILIEVEKELSRIVQSKPADHLLINDVEQGETTNQQQFIRLILFTLQHGYLPWWSTIKTMPQWQDAFTELLQSRIVLSANEIAEMKSILNKQFSLDRVINYLSVDKVIYWLFVKLIIGADESVVTNLQYFFKVIAEFYESTIITPVLRQILIRAVVNLDSQQAIVTAFSANVIEVISQNKWPIKESRRNVDPMHVLKDETLQIALKKIQYLLQEQGKKKQSIDAKKVDRPKSNSREKTENNSIKKVDESKIIDEIMAKLKFSNKSKSIDIQSNVGFTSDVDSIYINNAGLVIVAPFLTAFFKKLNLVNDDKLTDKAKAVTLLNYLVTGNTAFDEFDIVLNKVVCGEAIEAFIKPIEITAEEKQEADDLLAAVIEHWSVLKNTSPDGLRGNFLQREGRLMFDDSKWNLKVQEQSFDMLLAHLPWGIGVVKLPWMEHVLYVEWI